MSIDVGEAHEIEKLLAIDGFRDKEGDKALIGYPWTSRLSHTQYILTTALSRLDL